ncbi:MAG TPA: ABC transporter permease [Vicinamibacterales bacterium]|nr:ABC transporter permease [Vicinamibacterales bacterium]
MNALTHQLAINIKLHLRNRMALLYSYLFPTIFLVAFWVLYRFEQVPLVRHMGELLTVTALGGACFGLPTTMVSERERGVWRRYRLAPVSTATLVGGTVIARYLLLLAAGLLQLLIAMAVGMPMPRHPFELFVAFTFVAFAFIGLGLVIAMMADNVPAVQALGQCIFLPMLIIGGVAVPLTTLPEWAQRLSSFFPGRYAVETIQACVTGDGLDLARFSATALVLIGISGCLAGAMMFRWDAQQRFRTTRGKGWVAGALAVWVAIGLSAESGGRRTRTSTPSLASNTVAAPAATPAPTPSSAEPAQSAPPAAATPAPTPAPAPPATAAATSPATRAPGTLKPVPPLPAPPAARTPEPPSTTAPASGALPVPAPATPLSEPGKPASWRAVTMADIDRDLIFTRLPPDEGVVTPIARLDEEPDEQIAAQLEKLRLALPAWKPGHVSDPVQRVRNLLFVAAVPDVFQMSELEKFIPHIVYDYIQLEFKREDLIKILYWIALHPFEGDDSAVDELRPLGLYNGPADMETTRDRLSVYAVKLLGRITGKIVQE